MEKRNLTAYIVDDEMQAISNLENLISRFCPGVKVCGSARNVATARKEVLELNPDVIFLDIEMPGNTGFDLLDSIQSQQLNVIFVTSYNQHAVRAFRYSAIDYLLKPVDIDELQEAVKRVRERIGSEEYLDNMSILNENLNANKPIKIAISVNDGKHVLKISKIIAVVGEGSYSRIIIEGEKEILLSKGLGKLTGLLEEGNFFRIHKSYLINFDHIARYSQRDGGQVTMSNKLVFAVSRRRKEAFEHRFRSFYHQ